MARSVKKIIGEMELTKNPKTGQDKTVGFDLGDNVQLTIASNIEALRSSWIAAQPPKNIFLQCEYLTVLDQYPPIGMQVRYLLFEKDSIPVGVAVCQVQNFKAEESINESSEDEGPCLFDTFSKFLKGFVAKKIDYNSLVCGSLLLTGEHGFYFKPGSIGQDKQMDFLEDGISHLKKHLEKNESLKIALTLQKDYFKDNLQIANSLPTKEYSEFQVQPNMVLHIRKEWDSFESYLSSMTSKYRVRIKSALKKGKTLEKRVISLEEIHNQKDQIFKLYSNIAKAAGFNVVKLSEGYFEGLKGALGDDFEMIGYYHDNSLIGFHTTIANHGELEAHFLGYDKDHNRSFQLYFNMLIDMIKKGIIKGQKSIIFARTALEIKSSIGAVPYEMNCYIKHRNNFSNKFLGPLVEYLKPKQEWTQRHPFKPS